jgi:uncharacterized protein YfkK (UPF0435 family)
MSATDQARAAQQQYLKSVATPSSRSLVRASSDQSNTVPSVSVNSRVGSHKSESFINDDESIPEEGEEEEEEAHIPRPTEFKYVPAEEAILVHETHMHISPREIKITDERTSNTFSPTDRKDPSVSITRNGSGISSVPLRPSPAKSNSADHMKLYVNKLIEIATTSNSSSPTSSPRMSSSPEIPHAVLSNTSSMDDPNTAALKQTVEKLLKKLQIEKEASREALRQVMQQHEQEAATLNRKLEETRKQLRLVKSDVVPQDMDTQRLSDLLELEKAKVRERDEEIQALRMQLAALQAS